jgi:hypothetical protein
MLQMQYSRTQTGAARPGTAGRGTYSERSLPNAEAPTSSHRERFKRGNDIMPYHDTDEYPNDASQIYAVIQRQT